ncbi:MAG: hypothetical protein AB7F76_08305 [Parvibaculaceae bacterium]
MKQADFFETDDQPGLFPDDVTPVVFRADPEKVRAELHLILSQAKSAKTLPWSREDLRYHETVFPQMCRWLPEDEAAQLCFEFDTAIKRLLAA